MIECEKCGNFFRDKWNLNSHLSRKKSCNPNFTPIVNDTPENIPKNSPIETKNSTILPKNSTIKKNKCKFCIISFSTEWYKNEHEKTCKHNNNTRLLEIDMEIEPNIPKCKTECRFCHKNLSRTDSLIRHVPICKEREESHEKLLKEKENEIKTQQTIINNNNIINNTNIGTQNNLNIYFNENTVPFGNKRLTDHIKVEKVVEILRSAYNQYQPGQDYEIAGELLLKMEEYLQEIPENRNYRTDDKSPIWVVKTESGVKYLDKDKCIHNIIKENAGILCDNQDEINTHNKKVFQNKTISDAFIHEKEFEKKGIYHKPDGQRKMDKIKSGMLLVNKNVADF